MSIERRRKARGVTVDELAHAARIGIRTYYRALAGTRTHRSILDRLEAALEWHVTVNRRTEIAVVVSLHRLAMSLIARELGLDCESVLATDFSLQRPMNKAWLAAARVRRQAIALLVLDVGIAHATLARALGVTKQNVGQAVRQVYDLAEDDREVAARQRRLAKILTG